MPFGRVKIDRADKLFSLFIRTRDKWRCVKCLKQYSPPTTALQCSHFFGRGKESTRFDPQNCDALCYGCHQYWGSTNREAYREFKIRQLGQAGFDLLTLRANTPTKKDRKIIALYYSKRLKEMEKEALYQTF
jgi:hypothetical protein